MFRFKNDLRIELVGHVDPAVTKSIARYELSGNVQTVGFLGHADAVGRMETADVLLLLVNKSPFSQDIIPGKMYEYMATGKPILMIGPTDCDAAEILKETGCGVALDYEDFNDIQKVIGHWFDLHSKGNLRLETSGVEAYSRKNLTEQMAALLNELAGSKE